MGVIRKKEDRVLTGRQPWELRSCELVFASVEVLHSVACAFYLFIRVMEITDILSQNVPLEDVQYLAGHSNPSGHTDL